MNISAIQNLKLNTADKPETKSQIKTAATYTPNYTSIYNGDGLKGMTLACFKPSFGGTKFEDTVVKKVDGEYYGKGLYNENNFIDFDKCGWENLSKNQLDITKATDKEILAFQYANAFAEAKDTSWVQRFNPDNVTKALATFHTLCSQEAKAQFAKNLEELQNLGANKSLDKPITDKNGKLSLDCVVWDTETTGTNHSNPKKELDKIIQIGAIKVKNGDVVNESGLSQLIDPEREIPQGASNVHGIYAKDVKGQPKLNNYLKDFLNDYMNKEAGVIVAYNSKFDMTMLKNAINDYNATNKSEPLAQKRDCKVLDPFIMIQRIHPYVGAKKKLGEQYKFLFCKNLDGAHDAFADVKGTVNALKYCLYYLSEHRVDKSKPLTLREVLAFQNGGNVKNIDIPTDHEGCNSKVTFNKSYRLVSVPVDNYFKGYKLDENAIKALAPEIGSKNLKKLEQLQLPGKIITPSDENMDEGVNPKEETKTKKQKKEKIQYTARKNFKKALGYAELQPYKGKTAEQIIDLITDKSKNYVDENVVGLWLKNANPADIEEGNDMIDYSIAKRVMQEEKDSEAKA